MHGESNIKPVPVFVALRSFPSILELELNITLKSTEIIKATLTTIIK
jgi:hypothetical protein